MYPISQSADTCFATPSCPFKKKSEKLLQKTVLINQGKCSPSELWDRSTQTIPRQRHKDLGHRSNEKWTVFIFPSISQLKRQWGERGGDHLEYLPRNSKVQLLCALLAPYIHAASNGGETWSPPLPAPPGFLCRCCQDKSNLGVASTTPIPVGKC